MSGPRNATTTSRGRTYRWRDETFDSVTTIIGGGMPKPALVNWAPKMVAEYVAANFDDIGAILHKDPAAAIDLMKRSPWRERDAAANRGSEVHRHAEARVLGQPLPDPPDELVPYVESFVRFLDDFQPEFEMTEASVYNRRYGYAGTLDFIARLPGLGLVLGDYKTNRSGVYGEVALQLAAYRNAEFIGLPDGTEHPVPPVDACVAVHIRPEGYEVIPVEADERAFRFFLYCQQVRIFVETTSREVLGAPLQPARPQEVA